MTLKISHNKVILKLNRSYLNLKVGKILKGLFRVVGWQFFGRFIPF